MFYMMSDHLQEAYKSIYQRKELVSPPKDAEGTQGIMNPQGTPKAAQGGDHARQEVTKGRYRAAYEEYKQELRDYHIEKFIGWVESLDEDGYDISKWELSELSETYIRENNLQGSEEIITEALSEGSVRMARMVDRYLGRDKRKAKERKDNVGKIRKGRQEIASSIARLSNSPGGVPASVARQAEKVGVRPDHFRGASRTALKKEGVEYVDEGIIDAAKAGSKRHEDAMKGAGRAIKKAGIRARKLGKALEPAADTAKSAASGVGKAVKGTYEAGKKTGEFVKKGAQRHNDMMKAAKKVFNKEELELIAQIMIDEGYNLSDYTWEEFHTLCLDAEMLDENRAAARAAGGSKDDSKKQPDPSKAGFTGMGNMSIDQIRKMSARIEKEKTKKEEVEEYVDFLIDEGYDCSELTWEDMFEEYESLDEGLRSAVKRLLGKKEAPAEKKPESRGEQLRKKYNVGPEKSDTSAKRQILDRTRAKKERDQKEYGGSHYSKSVAKKSADAHDRYLRAGYSKYGADDRRGSGNKARKRAEALKKESFSDWRSEIGLSEEASDRNKDERLMRGGVDGNTNYRKSPARKLSNAELGIKPGKTAVQKELEKKHGKGATAMDIVKSEIRAKYGKKSIKD